MRERPASILAGFAVEQVFYIVNRAIWPNYEFVVTDEVDFHGVAASGGIPDERQFVTGLKLKAFRPWLY
jgi:hypothetical protein